MSRAAVRSAVATWFAPPNVSFLNRCYTSEPKLVPETEYAAGAVAGSASGAIGFVYLERELEQREAIGGATSGLKRIVYDVALVLRFRSTKAKGEDGMADYDTMIEAAKVRLRSDRTLGGSVFQAGEGDTLAAPDVEVISDLPRRSGEVMHIWSALRFKVIEFVQS